MTNTLKISCQKFFNKFKTLRAKLFWCFVDAVRERIRLLHVEKNSDM